MKRSLIVTVVVTALWTRSSESQERLFADVDRWAITGDASGFHMEQGERVLALRGSAALDDITFEDGVITFDVRLTNRAAFVGLMFRAGSDDAEHVYFRPHRSGEWDAVQYQPLMHGSTTWQLHRGEGYTAAATIPAGEWIPIRLDVRDSKAELFIGRSTDPVMRMQLERGVTHGGIAFTSGFRDEAPADEVPGSFRHLIVEQRSNGALFSWRGRTDADGPFIRTWEVSDPYPLSSVPATHSPDSVHHWTTVQAEPRGIINLNRYFTGVTGAGLSAVVARKQILSTSDVVVPMQFDFSDHASVFLNGELLFSGTNTWESRYPYYLGVLHPETVLNTIWLHLEQGVNQLSVIVSDAAFGWGFVARAEPVPGVTWQ